MSLPDTLEARALKHYARKLELRLEIAKQAIFDYKRVCADAARLLGKVHDLTQTDIANMEDWINEYDNLACTCSGRADHDPVTDEEKGDG